MADTLRAFSSRCLSSGGLMQVQTFAATKAVTVDLTGEVRASIKAAAPGGTVKGKRGRPVRIGAAYRLNPANRTGFVFARGPLQLVERDTKSHGEPKALSTDTARRARQRRAGFKARKTLKIPGIGYRRAVRHPGTKGKHPFQQAVDGYAASDRASRIYARHVNKVLREVAR